ncbi:hypothetical protein ACFVHR_19690 [Streptomyces sp. NPDC127168]|uniref:hypothetical protein n=1 Tax=unclassified Streptomyces TaxID=2593676 RepID=UPI003629020B
MLTSPAFGGQTKLLTALRHDARVVEQLAEPQARSSITGVQSRTGSEGVHNRSALSPPARELLKFSTPRDPAQLAAFITVRVRTRAPALAARHRGRGHLSTVAPVWPHLR